MEYREGVVKKHSVNICIKKGCNAPCSQKLCKTHRRSCLFEDCAKRDQGGGFCLTHGGGKKCQVEGCSTGAAGATRFCKAHGGGIRCKTPKCTKAAARPTDYCKACGGGFRCKKQGCKKSAARPSEFCFEHGGGNRCAKDGCERAAKPPSKFCVGHGGGKRCKHEACTKSARNKSQFCMAHGGGMKCKIPGCEKGAKRYGCCILHHKEQVMASNSSVEVSTNVASASTQQQPQQDQHSVQEIQQEKSAPFHDEMRNAPEHDPIHLPELGMFSNDILPLPTTTTTTTPLLSEAEFDSTTAIEGPDKDLMMAHKKNETPETQTNEDASEKTSMDTPKQQKSSKRQQGETQTAESSSSSESKRPRRSTRQPKTVTETDVNIFMTAARMLQN